MNLRMTPPTNSPHSPMPYIQSPTGTYHHRPQGGRRTKCGIRITEDWTAKDSKPNPLANPLTNECSRCEKASDRVEGLRVKRFDSPSERKAQKIREMQQQCSDTDPIG